MRALAPVFVAFGLWAGIAPSCFGQASADTVKRVALVIGNSIYKDAPLKNAVNDARLVAAKLKELGFDVVAREDATRAALGTAVGEFTAKLSQQSAALIYFAGHGIQSRGRNYLIPVDATLARESDLRFQAIDVSSLTEEIEQAQPRVSFIVLDACRNNPFERRLRGAARGLAAVDAARGALIAYATAPGSVAADGEGANGPFTEELVAALSVPNLKAEEVFKKVTAAVEERTSGRQTPWTSSSLRGDFIFNSIASTPSPTGFPSVSHEALFWQSIQSSKRAADFEAYLTQFPAGTFAALARNRIAELRPAVAVAGPPAAQTAPSQPPRTSLAAVPPTRPESIAAGFDGKWQAPFRCEFLNAESITMDVRDGVIVQFTAGKMRGTRIPLNAGGGFALGYDAARDSMVLVGSFDPVTKQFRVGGRIQYESGEYCSATLNRK